MLQSFRHGKMCKNSLKQCLICKIRSVAFSNVAAEEVCPARFPEVHVEDDGQLRLVSEEEGPGKQYRNLIRLRSELLKAS
jgi:hypothetical protein